MELIRSMITDITVSPREDGDGVDLDLSGDLARILHLCSATTMQNAQAVAGSGRLGVSYQVSVVAGTRNHLKLRFAEAAILERTLHNLPSRYNSFTSLLQCAA